MKRRGSSETRFPKVWCRSELCSRGERPFEVSKIFCPGTKPGRYETRPVRYLNPAGRYETRPVQYPAGYIVAYLKGGLI